ncbi:MAG TPA: ABC transporter permease [Vicinamibacterales bacterium]|nr:ABC transporter permease [Vicinamibacterales bacterium]
MATFIRDVRFAARMFAREPGLTLLVVLALALGIGATTAIFTVVDAVLLRPLRYAEPDRLVVAMHGEGASGPVSPADYLDYRRAARSFEGLSAAQAWGGTLGGGERPEAVNGLKVAADMFDLLGVPAHAGRTFVEGDDQPGRDAIVVLGYGLWMRRFGGDRSVVGRSLSIDGRPYVIVGVMPAGFRFAPFWQTRAEMWAPLSLAERRDDRGGRSLRMFGRLKEGVTPGEAQAEMSTLAAQLERAYPQTNTGAAITVRPLLDRVVAGIRPTLLALMAMASFVLLIACANVANALLARASGRQREIGIRLAIGASRGRIVRQMLTESLVLAGSGAAGGLLLAGWAINWLTAVLPAGSLPRQHDIVFDLRVAAAALLATVLVGLATGLVPALQTVQARIAGVLDAAGKGVTQSGRRKLAGRLLIAGEVALAVVLLVGAGLMARTMIGLNAVDPGFRADHLAVATVSLAGTPHHEAPARDPMFRRIREHLQTLPGVTAAGAINHLPLAGDVWTLGYRIEGQPEPPPGQRLSAVYRIVQPGYFAAMELPILQGRALSDDDGPAAPPVAVINQAMADRQWPGESPIGRRLFMPGMSDIRAPITIVGVTADARQSDWTEPVHDEVYLAYAQRSGEFGLGRMTFVLRTSSDPARLASTIPGEVALLDRSVAVFDNATMTSVVADELWRERLTMQLAGVFAAVALGLAAIGIYAIVAYSVERRTRELGVRIALGATRGRVVRLALGEALRPALLGLAGGVVAALGAARFIESLLFGVSALDPATLATAVITLLTVAAVAAWIPARRASRLDPLEALRRD